MAKPDKTDRVLEKLYYGAGLPSAYGGASKLIDAAKKQGLDPAETKDWLSGQDAYTLHKRIVRRFRTRRYTLLGIDDLWQADLADVGNLAKDNDGIKFWLVVIDTFTKYVWVRLLKNKTAPSILAALQNIVKISGRKPKNLNTDKGTEFTNKLLRTWTETEGINFYTAQNPDTKACFAERVIRTLKERLHRYFTHKNTRHYVTAIQDIVQSYNNTKHSATGFAPANVNMTVEDLVRQRLNPRKRRSFPNLKSGSTVRIAKEVRTFRKGYTPGWTEELFEIVNVFKTDPPVYQLKDMADELVAGRFYEHELQIVKRKYVFRIDRVIRRRRINGRKEALVAWLGYPLSMASWVLEKDIQQAE